MTTIDRGYYPPQDGAVVDYSEFSATKNSAGARGAGLGGTGRRSEDLPVTPEEEEAWINKLRDLAGMTV